MYERDPGITTSCFCIDQESLVASEGNSTQVRLGTIRALLEDKKGLWKQGPKHHQNFRLLSVLPGVNIIFSHYTLTPTQHAM